MTPDPFASYASGVPVFTNLFKLSDRYMFTSSPVAPTSMLQACMQPSIAGSVACMQHLQSVGVAAFRSNAEMAAAIDDIKVSGVREARCGEHSSKNSCEGTLSIDRAVRGHLLSPP